MLASIILALLIVAYTSYVIYKIVQNKKKGGCCGGCGSCPASKFCKDDEVHFEKDETRL